MYFLEAIPCWVYFFLSHLIKEDSFQNETMILTLEKNKLQNIQASYKKKLI